MRFDVQRGGDGRWFVIDGARRYVVPDALGEQLRLADGRRRWRALVRRRAPGPRRRSPWPRVTLLSAGAVDGLAARISSLAAWPAMAGMVVLAAVGILAAPSPEVASSASALAAVALFVLSGLWHELGHAAALRRERWPPGAIGLGLLWVLPVLWSDVSATSVLRRVGRVRVDLAGVAFQLGFLGVVGAVSRAADWSAGGAVVRAGLLAIIWCLLPVVRSDGHWLVCDVLGLASLDAVPPRHWGRARRAGLVGWRLVSMAAIAGVVGLVLVRVLALARAAEGPLTRPGNLLLVAVGVILVLGGLRALGRIVTLARAAVRDLHVGS
ncbi:hypothetical protein GF314_15055 [bacterium]|nr:hypothetical protein [bacterium]